MASIQPIVGHLLSQYKETVLDGLQKMEAHIKHDETAFANAFASDGQAMAALFRASQKGQDVLERCFGMARHLMVHCSPANRMVVARALCSKDVFPSIRTALSTVNEANLTHCLQSLALLSTVGMYCPKILLGRFGGYVPLHLPCFRLQLPFGLRRVRDARLAFLASLASSKYQRTTRDVVCTHGFLTQLLEDAAEVMRQGDGTAASVNTVKNVLDVVQHQYINATTLDVETKKSLLMGQRNILRILIKALTVEPIADRVSEMLYQLIDVVVEPSSDYAVSRTEVEDKGMPNFLVFSILRLLRPKHTAREAAISCYILYKCPDLIRPYFVRVSGHLADDTGSVRGTTTSPVSNVAIFNVVTRALLAPLPYHLRANVARLQPTSEGTHRFFSMTPKNVAEEVCPSWLGEFVHKRINNNTNLVVLLWAIQVTQAAVNRAMHAQQLIHAIHAASVAASTDRSTHRRDDPLAVDLEQFDAEFMASLETFLPRREEFWHRMTQQLQKTLTEPSMPSTTLAAEGAQLQVQRTQFVVERMLVLMDSYTSVFRLRVPWLSAAPNAAPRLDPRGGMTTVAALLASNCDVLSSWSPKAISTLCLLLCSSLSRGVQMPKLHHINMGNAPSTMPKTQIVADWPVLLSILQWFCRHKPKTVEAADALPDDTQEALGYVTRLALMCVHSVSVRYAAELNEVFLWLMELEEGLIPCFLHVLNLMLMRAMSKTAEKIASSLMETEHGVLVECAHLLVVKTREKATAAAAGGAGAKAGGGNIWQQDLERNIGSFEQLIARIVEKWPRRQKIFRRGLARAAHAIAEHALRGRKQLELAVLAAPSGKGTTVPLHELVEAVCFPTANEDDATAAARLMPAVESDVDVHWTATIAATPTLTALGKLLTKGSGDWLRSPALAWSTVRHMTALDAAAHATPTGADEAAASASTEQAMRFAARVLKFVATDETAAASFQAAQRRDLHAGGLLLCLLGCLQMVLRHACTQRGATALNDETLTALNAVVMASYGGTLTTADRMRYAALLHLHYIRDAAMNHDGAAEAAATTAPTHKNEDDDGSSAEDGSDNDDAAAPKKPMRKRAHAGEGVLLGSCVVPFGLRAARYATEGVVATPNVTREVDVLTQLLDAWTDQDAQCITGPVALSNGVYVRTSGGAMASTTSALSGLWRAVFPDVLTTRDRHVVDVLAATSPDAYDPRYLLPLVNTVAAIAQAKPELVPPHLLTRMFSLSVRALSYTCGSLRVLASNILALSSKFLTPLRRSLLNYARLCVVRIELSEARRGKVRDAAAPIPRLPCSVTAFLHMAQTPIHRYEHHLHNNVVGFLCDAPACFSSQVPLHQLLNAFPLGSITHTLMAKKQDEIVHGPGGAGHVAAATAPGARHAPVNGRRGHEKDSVLNEGAQTFQAALQQDTPAHLDCALSMVVHCSGTAADARRLIRTGTLSSLMSLVAMLSSTPALRLRVLRVLSQVCTATTADVASTYAVEGQVLSWAHFFAAFLTEELGADRDALAGPVFCGTLSLILRLLRSLSGRSAARQLAMSAAAMETLTHRLKDLCVSSKEVWDAVDAIRKITSEPVA